MIQEMLYYLGNKALIRNNKNEVLLLHVTHKNGNVYWDLPGGRVNKGEEVLPALTREVKEETGITTLTIGKHLGIALTNILLKYGDEKAGLILSVYSCTATDTSSLVSEDGVEIVWCPGREAIERLVQFPSPLREAMAAEL